MEETDVQLYSAPLLQQLQQSSTTERASARVPLQLPDAFAGYLNGVTKGEGGADCVDSALECKGWAASGECEKNTQFMLQQCALSCGQCGKQPS